MHNQLQEKLEKKAFNASYQASDRSMALLTGTLRHKIDGSPTAESIEIHATARRTREKLETQMAELQRQIKERKQLVKK